MVIVKSRASLEIAAQYIIVQLLVPIHHFKLCSSLTHFGTVGDKMKNVSHYIMDYQISRNNIIISILIAVIIYLLYYHYRKNSYKEGFILRDDKVSLYAINLNKDKDRYSKLMKYYTNSDLADHHKLNLFSAIYGKDVDPEMWLTPEAMNEMRLIEKNGYRTHHHSITRGGLGCFLSHYRLAKNLVNDKDVDYYLILEDDTKLFSCTYRNILRAAQDVPNHWDMVLFYTIRSTGRSENNFFNKLKSFWGLNCYIINKTGAQKLVNEVESNKIDGQIDSYLSRMIQQGKMNIYATKTHLVSTYSSETNIQVPLKEKLDIDPYNFKGYRM